VLDEERKIQPWSLLGCFNGGLMVSKDLLDMLRCPNCVQEKDGLLEYYRESWLICQDCDRKYPIVDDIPVMLIDEGDKWVDTAKEDLPVPPPPMD
jgi:uncharacterized protein YbaR (Trm112 family)